MKCSITARARILLARVLVSLARQDGSLALRKEKTEVNGIWISISKLLAPKCFTCSIWVWRRLSLMYLFNLFLKNRDVNRCVRAMFFVWCILIRLVSVSRVCLSASWIKCHASSDLPCQQPDCSHVSEFDLQSKAWPEILFTDWNVSVFEQFHFLVPLTCWYLGKIRLGKSIFLQCILLCWICHRRVRSLQLE